MNEAERWMQERLAELIDAAEPNTNTAVPEEQFTEVRTFEEEGVMTLNAGLVIELESGVEFQVTIVQSQRAR